MSIFGNIQNGVFSGFGKPYIKLEFDDNTALLDFQKRMNESGEAQESEFEDGEFRPIEGTEELTKTEFKNFFNNPEPFREVKDITKDFKDYIYINYPNTLRKAYKVETPLKGKEKNVYVFADFEHLKFENSTKQDREDIFGLIKPTLENPDLVFVADGENNFVKSFNSKNGSHIILNFIPTSKNGFLKTDFIKDFDKLYKKYKKNGSMLKYTHTAGNFNGLGAANIHDFYFVEVRFPCAYKDDLIFSDNQIFDKKNLGAPGDVYLVKDTRKNPRKELDETAAFKKIDIEKFNVNALKALQDSDPLLYEEIKAGINAKTTLNKNNIAEVLKREIIADVKDLSDINTPATITPLMKQYNEIKHKYPDAVLLFKVGTYYETFGEDAKKIASVLGIRLTNRAGQYYAGFKVRDLDKNLKKLIKAGVKVAVCEQTEQALGAVNYYVKAYYPGLGKTANPYLYNNNEIIDCRGLKPTYKILDNYDNFFDVADSKTNFAGFGLTDTKKLISETCRAHWKDCKKIAAHLKGDSLLQSCFNLWHWLRFNIRYEYDKEGREEIRTPLRVWQDRARGVDCDCLSVFSWCVLRCMGYDPVFELVAFKNRPQFSHIFINCDGVVVDRVWFVFNSRPPLVTKRELFRVDLINNLGQLF